MTKEELIELAISARERSYSPYSHFAVGAALLCTNGRVFYGANIENASYPMSMCAERIALYNAMMDGFTREDFEALAVVGDTTGPCSPCGACRQVISELFPTGKPIYLANLKGDVMEVTVESLLPYAFDDSDL